MAEEKYVSAKNVRILLGKNLKRLRTRACLSQLALAGKCDLAHTFINDIENGKKWISCKTMIRLCSALNVEPHHFFFPEIKPDHEQSEILSSYLDDFSEYVRQSVADFKSRYLGEG